MKQSLARVLTLLALGAAASCTSQTAVLHGRFTAVHNTLVTLGVDQVGNISEGSLADGGTARFPMDLEAQCYTFVAFGSDGARDLDVSVVDANNTRLAGDNTHDAHAAARFCAPSRGRYTVAVHMAEGSGAYLLSSWRGGGGAAGGGAAGNTAGTCGNPLPVRVGQTVTGSTAQSQSHHTGSCVGSAPGAGEDDGPGAPEAVYALTVERRQLVTVAVETQGNFDGVVYLRGGGCDEADNEVPQACNDDDGDTSHSRIAVPLDPGTYYIFVDGFGRARGAYSMTVTAADVPNIADLCQNAATLTPNTPVTGQLGAQDLNLFQARCGNNARGPDRVYRLDVPQESRLQVHQESDYDGVIYLRRACAEASTEVDCNDDAEDVQHSRINAVVPAGTYYVFTDGYQSNASGNYTLEADLAPVAGGNTPGDACTDAQPLTPGTPAEGNTFQARDDVASPCAAQADGYDVVYRLDVPNRSRVKLWFESADLRDQATITVTRNCAQVGQATCRAGAVNEAHAWDQVLDPGQYFVVVDSAQPRRFGRFRLMARLEDSAEIERLCRTAPLLTPGRTVTGTTSGTDRFQATCGGGARSPENLYRLVIRRRSSVRLAVTSTTAGFDPVLHLRQTCSNAGTERACNDDAGDAQHSLVEATLDPGTYTVFVDGYSANNAGGYSLETTVSPSTGPVTTGPTPVPPAVPRGPGPRAPVPAPRPVP